MNAEKRLRFVIEHMTTTFRKEILRDLDIALNEARADELEETTTIGRQIYHYNADGSTLRSKELRIKDLRGEKYE